MSNREKPEITVRDGHILQAHKCALCNKCWIYTQGHLAGKCLYNGPFTGFIKAAEEMRSGK